eukprot:SAG31_NODE_1928_length_6883_cov_6.045106_3_plen_76_part_00
MLLQLLGAGGVTAFCANSGLDWVWLGRFRPLPVWALLWVSLFQGIVGVLPFMIPWVVWFRSARIKRGVDCCHPGF